jgi:UDP-N-acetylmuramate dehydrogenase
MIIRESVPLSTLTTFKIGGNARYAIDCENESDIRMALAFAREHSLPWYPLGEGSNVLAPDAKYDGVIIRLRMSRLSDSAESDGQLVVAEAGLSWDALVEHASAREWWGIENLAGIPGTVGGAPIQNIGAYGTELADTLTWVEALNPETEEIERFSKTACEFRYRDSRFKRHPELIIVRVALTLTPTGTPRLTYADLKRLVEAGEQLDTPARIASAVRKIRSRKFPDLREEGTAGSFFKNPVVSEEAYAELLTRYPDLPGFPAEGGIKVSLRISRKYSRSCAKPHAARSRSALMMCSSWAVSRSPRAR